MERFNIFNLIHKGLRASLYHTALQLQQTDFADEDQTEESLNRIREIIMLFESHAHKEDSFILPAISQYEPSVANSFEEEHVKDEQLARQLTLCIDAIERSSSLVEKIVAGRKLVEAFEAFTIFNLQHMSKEENILNNILWRYYNDDEIRNISNSISKSVAPWLQDFYATWMMRGINDAEASAWMKSVEQTMPPVVLKTLIQKAGTELNSKRFQKITGTFN